MRLAFFHGMDTYAEFQVGSLAYQDWTTAPFDWVTASAPHRGADFSTGAGGAFLRKKFGYEPRKSRSWRLLTQYSLNSPSQASMFARIREATDLAALVTVSTSIVPPNAQLRRLNAHVGSLVSGEDSRAELPIEATGRRASAGRLSSFGFSGTIAHGLYVPDTVACDLVGASSAQSLFRRAAQIARAGV